MPLTRGSRLAWLLAAFVLAASCDTQDIGVVPPPPSPTPPPPPAPEVLVGAGDIASCPSDADEQTASIIDTISGTVFTLGDNAYDNGSADEYSNCYNPSWGRFKARTRPVLGNHEYNTAFAAGYFGYFDPRAVGDPDKGYYSYDLGAWHIIVLNSNISMSSGSTQVAWLKADLAASTKRCTIAMWHHPRFSSGSVHGSWGSPQPLWQALYDAGAEIVLVGHEHFYERFAPQTPTGQSDPQYGLRQFIVGTGGSSNYPFATPLANSEVRQTMTPGVLKLLLKTGSYTWQFIPVAGKNFSDSGEGTCHDKNPNPPTVANGAVLTVAGNIGDCNGKDDDDTGLILDTIPGTILTLGDNAFPNGSLQDYDSCYQPSWGHQKTRTYATLGNHEYQTPGAQGAFEYWEERVGPQEGLGYYSFDIGAWHVIVLNDNIPFNAGSPQDRWLVQELATGQHRCTMAAWHQPQFLSSNTAGFTSRDRRQIWKRLYTAGVDVVVNGHQHHYERMGPMNPDGARDDAGGIRQFNVGTGGESIELPTVAINPQSEARSAQYGVVRFALDSTGYRWDFIPVSGAVVDSGSGTCH